MTTPVDIPLSASSETTPSSGDSPLVSVVIVCMNNPKWLEGSLGSLLAHTTVPCEVLVVAYRFSPENLALVRGTYPRVEFIESNDLRGFSENNNLALRRARGKYCFVVNDDTRWDGPLIDDLVAAFDRLPPDAAVVSPSIDSPNPTARFCGRPPVSLVRHAFHCFGLDKFYRTSRPGCVNQKGLFRTHNLSGACFLIKTAVFRECGWFDERFFFCPEDVVLSEKLNRLGWTCHVFEPARITHFAGGSRDVSDTILATNPAAVRGLAIMYADRGPFQHAVFVGLSLFNHAWRSLAWLAVWLATGNPRAKRMAKMNRNCFLACASRKTPKQLFAKYHKAGKP